MVKVNFKREQLKRFNKYIKDVHTGRAKVGNLVKLAITRHEQDRERSDLVWKPRKGFDIVYKIEKYFRFWDDRFAGKPVKLEPWQVFSLMLKYGWFYTDDGRRRFTKSYEEVARKNGKTIKKAWEALYHVMGEGQSSDVFCGATTEQQARLLTNSAGQTVNFSPDIKRYFDLFYWRKKISQVHYSPKNSNIETLTSQAGKQDGLNPGFGIMDEFHEHADMGLYNVIMSAMGVRENPKMDIITTAGFNKHGPCYQKRTEAINILEGTLENDDLLVLISTIDADDDWKDEQCWYKASPNLGVSQPLSTMRGFFTDAVNNGGSEEVNFKTKRLNVWTDSAKTWISTEKWALCNKGPIQIERRKAFGSVQLAATRGINCFCLLLPNDNGGEDCKFWFWMPKDIAMEDELKDNYLRFAKDGWLTLTPGNVIDYDFIIHKIKEIREWVDLKNIQYAPQYEGSLMPLTDEGFILEKCANNNQNMTDSLKQFEARVEQQAINHEGNPVLAWMMGHVALKYGPDKTVRIDKDASMGNVSGPVALLMAYKGFLEYKLEPSPGVY